MDSEHLDILINAFESMVRDATSLFSVTPRDWRPLFTKAKEIQEGFNSRVRYPTKRERDEAWVRFNDLRTKVYEHANKQRSDFRAKSEALRDEILRFVKWAGYSWTTDVVFFFLPTTVEEMKEKGKTLKEAGQMLSRNKHEMLKEHKDECFARILELRQTHDAFWGQYKQQRTEKLAESERRRGEIADRINSNIRANGERLEKATSAYARLRANLESNVEKLESAYNLEFAARVAGWIEEDKEKLRSISDSIERLKGWIEEDETRLSDLQNRNSR